MNDCVLIVEDEAKNMKLVRELLQLNGYKTAEAVNGEDAVKLARSLRPALILMDLQMPVMNGLEATKSIKSHPDTKGIPVVALTAQAMSGDAEMAYTAGCDAYISKPIDIHEFIRLVKRMFPQ